MYYDTLRTDISSNEYLNTIRFICYVEIQVLTAKNSTCFLNVPSLPSELSAEHFSHVYATRHSSTSVCKVLYLSDAGLCTVTY